jgi:hypothetical protein
MAIKIYKEGASAVVDDGTEVIISSFSYEEENEIITILDQESFNNVWNDYWYRLQKKDGSSCGATLRDVLDYLATVTSGEGGGSSTPLANFSMVGTITNFLSPTNTPSTSIGTYSSQTYYNSFRLESTTKIQNIGFRIASLSGTSGAKAYSALYKYDIDTDNLNLVAVMPSEIDIDSATGVTGWNFINLGSSVTLEPGIYFSRYKTSATVQIGTTNTSNGGDTLGIEGVGTSTSMIHGFYELGIAYDFGSTPTSITFSGLLKGTNASYAVAKGVFYRLTN